MRFTPGCGAPEQAVFPKLQSWTEHTDEGIRYYSGSAVYSMRFDVQPASVGTGRRLVLDLGTVKNFAEVTLNGKSFGVLWKAPFAVDVTGALKPGSNQLEVRVTNLWPNRLIGDEQKPAEVEWRGNTIARWPDWLREGKPRPTSDRFTFTTWRFWWKDSPLIESGLLGPVVIRSSETIVLRL